MGIWDFIYSTTETVKNNAPNLDPVKDACKSSYGYDSAACGKIDNAVGVNGIQKLKHSMPDEQGRARITLYASKFVQNAFYYGFKEALPSGGKMISKIVSQTVKDVESENRKVVKEGTDASGKSSFGYHQKGISADSASPANQTPEDVLRFFMMKQFIGTHFLDNLIIPQKGLGKESK